MCGSTESTEVNAAEARKAAAPVVAKTKISKIEILLLIARSLIVRCISYARKRGKACANDRMVQYWELVRGVDAVGRKERDQRCKYADLISYDRFLLPERY
jgi:hypothetical protein